MNSNQSNEVQIPESDRKIIQMQEVVKIYPTAAGGFNALNGINLDIQPGEFLGVLGKSGAGKSTLLNTLTKSNVRAESRLFATLDPSSRRIKFPKDIEVVMTDTVGFIKNLPKDLMVAFRATLEELENANLLLHVIDISNPRFKDQICSVENILTDLNLDNISLIRVLNKKDLVAKKTIKKLAASLNGIPISANDESTVMPLIKKMESAIDHVTY